MKQVDVQKYKFGVFGYGFLGSSIVHVFNLHADIKIYDKFKDFDTAENVVKHSDYIWFCLPTPMRLSDGTCDLSIIEENAALVNELAAKEGKKTVVIKSTVPPGTCRSLQEKYQNLIVLSCPEFLTARNHLMNSVSPSRIIIGSSGHMEDRAEAEKLAEAYRYRFGNAVNIYVTGREESEITKYGSNIFFCVKLSYFNLIWSMCEKMGIDFDEVRDMIVADGRIAISHSNTPGHDGDRGYGGFCFPKDINALIHFAKQIGVDPMLLEASWEQNIKYDRQNKDWEKLPSAATNDTE